MASTDTSNSDEQRPMESRVGRTNQRYGPQGERLVAGIVPLSDDRKRVLVVQSRSKKGWVFPKGGWETDEPTAEEAAKREAWEEAGIEVDIIRSLGPIRDTAHRAEREDKPAKASTRNSLFEFFEATVRKELDEYPEMRPRKWCTYTEVLELLRQRPELLEALARCSLEKPAANGCCG